MNTIALGGRLTRDSELRYTSSGLAVTSCAIAVNKPYSKGTDFFNIVAFGKKAETLAEVGLKGRFINLNGYLTRDDYKDKQGNNRTKHSVTVEWFTVVDWNNKDDDKQEYKEATKQQDLGALDFNDEDDDLPF